MYIPADKIRSVCAPLVPLYLKTLYTNENTQRALLNL